MSNLPYPYALNRDYVLETINHVEQGHELALQQFDGKRVFNAILDSLTAESQAIENTLTQLLTQRNIYDAVGQQLDDIGELLVTPRPYGMNDDDYRILLFTSVIRKFSSGTPEDMIRGANVLYQGNRGSLVEYYTGNLVVITNGQREYAGGAEALNEAAPITTGTVVVMQDALWDAWIPSDVTPRLLDLEVNDAGVKKTLMTDQLVTIGVYSGNYGFTGGERGILPDLGIQRNEFMVETGDPLVESNFDVEYIGIDNAKYRDKFMVETMGVEGDGKYLADVTQITTEELVNASTN